MKLVTVNNRSITFEGTLQLMIGTSVPASLTSKHTLECNIAGFKYNLWKDLEKRVAYLGRCGSGEGLDWAGVGLPNPRSRHLQRRSRERKTGSELGGDGGDGGSVEGRCGPAARPHPPLRSARCGSGGPPASCSSTGPPRPSSWGLSAPLGWRRRAVPPCSTFFSSPWLD